MKIIFVATTSWNHYNSRLGLARILKAKGHEILFLAPRDEFSPYLVKEGMRWFHLPLKPRGKNPLQEIGAILFLSFFFLKEKPDLVNTFTPKGVIYSSIAARLAGVKKIFNTITGLGYVFSGNKEHTLKRLVILLYKIALGHTKVLFQNNDDLKYFILKKIVTVDQCMLISGSGVDMDKFVPIPEPGNKQPVVMLTSRFVEEKGIRYFVEASRILKAKNISARFVLVGRPEDDQPTSIQHAEITGWIKEALLEWWGWHNNMEEIYPLANIVCLPTYYMEGIPKSLIEAAACGRALIATDVPGCREIVHHEQNGLLVPVKDAHALSDAITLLVTNHELRAKMGARSREIALADFSIQKVAEKYCDYYGAV